MMAHFPVLQVVIPLMAAPACLFLRSARWMWGFSVLAGFSAFLVSAVLLAQVAAGGTIIYELGGWQAPWGIEYRIDLFNAWVAFVVSAASALVLLASYHSVRKELDPGRQIHFYVLYLLCLAGFLGIVATGDLFNVFVFLEISALSTYALVSLSRDRRALTAAFRYLVIGTVGATFILAGTGLLYAMTGTLNMVDLSLRLSGLSGSQTVLTAFILFVTGICLKLALFPMHFWLPEAYARAPSMVTALLAATATKVALYVLIRVVFTIFGIGFFTGFPLQELFMGLSLAGILFASVMAIRQQEVKLVLAWSSLAQISFMVLGVAIGNETGLVAMLVHFFNHTLIAGVLFLAAGAVALKTGGTRLEHFGGLTGTMPWTMTAVLVGAFSVVGLPLTAGFISKWYLMAAALESGLWPVAVLILAASLLAAAYMWRILDAAFQRPPVSEASAGGEAPTGLFVSMWCLVLANVYFGIDTRLPVGMAESIVSLLGGGGL